MLISEVGRNMFYFESLAKVSHVNKALRCDWKWCFVLIGQLYLQNVMFFMVQIPKRYQEIFRITTCYWCSSDWNISIFTYKPNFDSITNFEQYWPLLDFAPSEFLRLFLLYCSLWLQGSYTYISVDNEYIKCMWFITTWNRTEVKQVHKSDSNADKQF